MIHRIESYSNLEIEIEIENKLFRLINLFSFVFVEIEKMSSTKKMSIFVLQPNSIHSSWQSEKLTGVFQVSVTIDDIIDS